MATFASTPRLLEVAHEELRDVVLDAHAGEDDGELDVLAQELGLADDLRGDLVVRQAVAAEDRQLLPAHQRVHAVDGGDAGLDEVARDSRGE